jgi:hypothetical protein
MSLDLVKCKDCKYFKDGDDMECHRYPPVLILTNPSGVGWTKGWPKVAKDDKCGEGVAKE